jgi:hypothetical protein
MYEAFLSTITSVTVLAVTVNALENAPQETTPLVFELEVINTEMEANWLPAGT